MSRYRQIQSVSFGETSLPLPMSVRLSRRAETAPAVADNEAFATSVQILPAAIVAEVRIRGTAVAEALELGQQATLGFTVAPAQSDAPSRSVTITGAILSDVELEYDQASMATARLRFVAEASDGSTNPYTAEEV